MSKRTQSLQALLQRALTEHADQDGWQPPVDVYRAGNSWLVKFDLAGVRPEDIEVELDGPRLTVRGMRRDWKVLEGQQAYSMEISYNRFQRVVTLPANVERSQLVSEYRDGMFLVTITPALESTS